MRNGKFPRSQVMPDVVDRGVSGGSLKYAKNFGKVWNIET